MVGVLLRQSDPALWESYLSGREAAPAESGLEPVVSRWKRVEALGVRPEQSNEPAVVSEAQLRERRRRVAPLLEAAVPLMENAVKDFSNCHYSLLLADTDGVIIERLGGGEFDRIARASDLVRGAWWGESVRGTNAIGTALVESTSVAVEGCAHWERRNHCLSCYATPIYGPRRALMGVLDATSFCEAASGFVGLAVSSLASNIEHRLAIQAYEAQGGLAALTHTLLHVPRPAFVVEPGGVVRASNASGRAWLESRPNHDLLVEDLWQAVLQDRSRVDCSDARLQLDPIASREGAIFAAMVLVEAPAHHPLPRPSPMSGAFDRLAGSDPKLVQAKQRGEKFAQTNLPVLLLAETGTGKELMARAVHDSSPRRDGPFVALNCGALSETLLESELFGHGPGAFTGAHPNGAPGKLEASEGGTLFLDEVAEMPPRLQALLLRVLEDGTFHRVGEVTTRHADFRLVAATCRDLGDLVAEGTFRKDLYFRIRGACLGLPPMRERDDRLEVARAVMQTIVGSAPVPAFSDSAIRYIETHDWPGNVRELKSALAHAYALDMSVISAEHMPAAPTSVPAAPMGAKPRPAPANESVGPAPSLRDSEAHALDLALASCNGNLSTAARQLGVARSTLYRMMRRHGRR